MSTDRILAATAVLIVMIVLGIAYWVNRSNAQLEEKVDETGADAAAQGQAVDALADQVRALGGSPIVEGQDAVTPVTGPQGDTGPRGDQGPQGPQGIPGSPTQDQVREAVENYFNENPISGGRPPTQAEIQSAVDAYCNARGGCIGPPGSTGETGEQGVPGAQGEEGIPGEIGPQGTQGSTGTQGPQGIPGEIGPQGIPGPTGAQGQQGPIGAQGETGAQGPAPTQEQINSAVQTFCSSNNNCIGPQGPAGAIGPAGRGITNMECEGGGVLQNLTITITYSDGTTQVVECE